MLVASMMLISLGVLVSSSELVTSAKSWVGFICEKLFFLTANFGLKHYLPSSGFR